MSQALSPFARKAGIASSILAISQLSFASVYIWVMGSIGTPSISMLLIILLAAGVIGMALLRMPTAQASQKVVTCE